MAIQEKIERIRRGEIIATNESETEVTTKDLTKDDINSLTIVQLYNFLYVPAIEKYEEYQRLLERDEKRYKERANGNAFETPKIPLIITGNHFEYKAARKISTLISLFNQIKEYQHELVIFSGGKSDYITRSDINEQERRKRLEEKYKEWKNYFEDVKGMLPEGKPYPKFRGLAEYYCGKKDVDINNSEAVKNMIMELTESEMMYYLFDEFGMVMYGETINNTTILLEDESSITPKNISNSYRLIVYSKENTNPNIDITKMAVMAQWEHLSRAVLTAEQFNPNLTVYGVPSAETIVLNLDEFMEIARREIRKFVEYKDVAAIETNKFIKIFDMTSCDPRGPNVYNKDGICLLGPGANIKKSGPMYDDGR